VPVHRWTTGALRSRLASSGSPRSFRATSGRRKPPFQECLDVARREGNQQGLRTALLGLGYVALQRADHALAAALLGDGLDVASELGDPLWTIVGHVYLGELDATLGTYASALAHEQEALALARETGSDFFLAFCLSFLGKLTLACGDPARARELFEEGLALPMATGHASARAISLLGLSQALQALGERDPAGQALEQARAVADESGDKLVVSWVLDVQGEAARARADWEEAQSLHQEAISLRVQIGHVSGLVGSLERLAGLACEQGRFDKAVRLLAASEAFRSQRRCQRFPTERSAHEAAVERARRGLGEEQFRLAWDQGAALSLDEAVQYALRRHARRPGRSTGWESLTRSERDVVRLVAQGLTNPEIGRRLFISHRTVQSHLAHVFAKLDVRTRDQVAQEA